MIFELGNGWDMSTCKYYVVMENVDPEEWNAV